MSRRPGSQRTPSDTALSTRRRFESARCPTAFVARSPGSTAAPPARREIVIACAAHDRIGRRRRSRRRAGEHRHSIRADRHAAGGRGRVGTAPLLAPDGHGRGERSRCPAPTHERPRRTGRRRVAVADRGRGASATMRPAIARGDRSGAVAARAGAAAGSLAPRAARRDADRGAPRRRRRVDPHGAVALHAICPG